MEKPIVTKNYYDVAKFLMEYPFNASQVGYTYLLKSISFASKIPESSSKVITKSTSLLTLILDASSFLAAQGPINTTLAFGVFCLIFLAVGAVVDIFTDKTIRLTAYAIPRREDNRVFIHVEISALEVYGFPLFIRLRHFL